ncbi:Protein kinase superfamily protein [Forsythia ovata]|uniref:Protein kinase superfamily protein n=1 Tax=Forsythia ovata TaxID=205694 RepID=A0ABD1SK86_9LAMI
MIDIACALEYLHYGYSTYIVHCDLKPSNVLLDEDMVAHLSDFGIAKLLGEGESNAHTTTMGTLGYIAPATYNSCDGLLSLLSSIAIFDEIRLGPLDFPSKTAERNHPQPHVQP